MVVGIGCDLVEVERVKRALQQHGFAERVYTEVERRYCQGTGTLVKYQSYAACFAAKEAFLKALGTGLRQGSLQDVWTEHDELGKPELQVRGYFAQLLEKLGVQRIHLTLSHTGGLAQAFVVLEA